LTNLPIQFAQASDSGSSGLGAFNLNVKGFLFQLVTFLLVLLILRKLIVPKLVETIDKRRETLEQSLEHARQTEEALAQAETRAEDILTRARAQADEALAEAKDAGAGIVAQAETAAGERAGLIVKEAEARLGEEREKLRTELRAELADLVADATEKIIHEKLDPKRDMSLIERAIKGIAG
jgi:F-type H+-transporting ATPase subunit b